MRLEGNQNTLLEVVDLRVHFPVKHGIVKAVDGVGFDIKEGETLGLVGESGCGKTTLGRAIIRLIEPTSGSVRLEGDDLATLNARQLRARRRKIQMIFQDPYNSLDPRMTIENVIGEALDIHKLARDPRERRKRVGELLAAVGLDAAHAQCYPHEFSGGQRQRIGIARALAVEPKLIVCDEPVSALDVSIQAQIVNLLQDLQRDRRVAYLFVAHNLAVVQRLSHRVMVMYLGKIVESGPAGDVIATPQHPYTQALISAIPQIDPASRRQRIVLSGEMPSPLRPPVGCPFHPRCPRAEPGCASQAPEFREVQPDHWASCHFAPFT